MGDIADMMLDGTLCECCGVALDEGKSLGVPGYCSKQCAIERGVTIAAKPKPSAGKMQCPFCPRQVKITGLGQHVLAVHVARLERAIQEWRDAQP